MYGRRSEGVLVVSWVRYVEVGGQFHAAAAVPPGKEIFGPVLLRVGWLPEQVWILYLIPLLKSQLYGAVALLPIS
jgi:carbon starvation protein CstA